MKKSSYIHANTKQNICTDVLLIGKIISNCARYNILVTLLSAEESRQCIFVNDIATSIQYSPSGTSHQLAFLEAHDIVQKEKKGQQVCYSYAPTKRAQLVRSIIHLVHAYES